VVQSRTEKLDAQIAEVFAQALRASRWSTRAQMGWLGGIRQPAITMSIVAQAITQARRRPIGAFATTSSAQPDRPDGRVPDGIKQA
jgi:hypothetical protein